jgi:hypothetical protein
MHRRVFVTALGMACLAVAVGCSGKPGRQPVSGRVTYRGEPLRLGTVSFTPEDRAACQPGGASLTDGAFRIETASGLFPGRYTVSFSAPDPKTSQAPPGSDEIVNARELLPKRHNDESRWSVEIRPGTNDFVFDLD